MSTSFSYSNWDNFSSQSGVGEEEDEVNIIYIIIQLCKKDVMSILKYFTRPKLLLRITLTFLSMVI